MLCGSYDEERLCKHEHRCEHVGKRHVKWFNFIRGSDFHRITKLHGEVWTLFITGPRRQGWGFREWDPGYECWEITPHELYIARKKEDHDSDNVNLATGDALDKWGEIMGMERATYAHNEPHDDDSHIEDDESFRERIVQYMRTGHR